MIIPSAPICRPHSALFGRLQHEIAAYLPSIRVGWKSASKNPRVSGHFNPAKPQTGATIQPRPNANPVDIQRRLPVQRKIFRVFRISKSIPRLEFLGNVALPGVVECGVGGGR